MNIFGQLNEVQQAAVKSVDGAVLVLAGAGSGKTRVITHRIAYLLHEGIAEPREILAMTFTNKAAREMRSRIEKFKINHNGLWMGTFHSIFARILRIEAKYLKYTSDFVIYDTEDKKRLIKSVLDDWNIDNNQFPPKSISGTISRLKNKLIAPADFQQQADTFYEKKVSDVYSEYQKRLRKSNAFDFDDLITAPIDLFKTYPKVLKKYQSRFKYVLVDEYQDTNHAQYKLVHYLSGHHKNICVVGDDDQSIYGWRGADIRNILEFEKDFTDTKVFRLEQNYRSTKTILKAANSVVVNNEGRKSKKLWCDNHEGEKIDIFQVLDERGESKKIVELIKNEVYQNKRSFGDFVVLYRTNAQSRSLEEGLRKNNIAYVIVGGTRFYERKEIKDILAYLKLISNSKDSVSLKRIINFPIRGIGMKTIQILEQWAREKDVDPFEAAGRIDEIENILKSRKAAIKNFYKLILKYINLKDEISPNELVHALIDEAGLLRKYKEDTSIEGIERANNIREFLAAVSDYAVQNEEPSLSDFLEQVSLITDIDSWNEKTNAISLMTLHSAKGLEFPVVFLAGMEEGLFPIAQSLDNNEKLEEERRLFYVGLTRAEEKVYIMWAENRRTFRYIDTHEPSRFLNELEEDVVKRNSYPRPKAVKKYNGTGSSVFSKDAQPAYEDYSQEESDLKRGVKVEHEVYGKGKVINVTGKGKAQKVVVSFESGVKKKFLSNYARFIILSG